MMARSRPAAQRDMFKVGLAVSHLTGPEWINALATALLRTGYVDLTLIHVDARAVVPARDLRWRRRLWRAFLAADLHLQRLVCPESPDPSAAADLRALGCTVAEEVPDHLSLVINAAGPSALTALRNRRGVPVWWFDHDGHELWPAVQSAYAETLDHRGVTCCRLMGLPPDSETPAVLREASMATHPLFGAENRVQLLWKGIPLLLQKLHELRDSGPPHGVSAEMTLDSASAAADVLPEAALPFALAYHAWRSARFVLKRTLWRDQWFLLLGQRAVAEAGRECDFVDMVTSAFRPARTLVPTPDRYWADPHLLPRGEDRFVLVEEYVYAHHRGRIALLRLDESGEVAEVRTVLERSCHLSYPAVFQLAGELYMVPESSERERIDAYRCTSFPWRWEHARTLLAGVRACDSSIFEHGGRWWLFATVVDESWLTPRDSLNVYYARDPLNGPWLAHPENPVVCDAHRARPAGRPFVCDGRLYRPSQDCSRGYGYGVRINEITTLTESHFAEREAAFLEPDWHDAVATHTVAFGSRAIVVDAMRWVLRRPRRRGDRA